MAENTPLHGRGADSSEIQENSPQDHHSPLPSDHLPLLAPNPIDRFYATPAFVGWMAIISATLGIIGLFPIFYDVFFNQHSVPATVILSVCFTLLVVVVAWASNELRKNHRLEQRSLELTKAIQQHALESHASETELKVRIEQEVEINRSHRTRELFLSGLFRDIARSRAEHSANLYALQSSILSTPSPSKIMFEKAWSQQLTFLDDYCGFVSRLFTTTKGVQCCANVKVIWDSRVASAFEDVLNTEFGCDSSIVPIEHVAYQTLSRCQASRNSDRAVGEQDEPRMMPENVVFRGIYRKKISRFISDDIIEDVRKWRLNPAVDAFQFPDEETPYSKFLSVPIYVEGQRTRNNSIYIEKFYRLIGYLSVDNESIDTKFDTTVDLAMSAQMAFDIASSFYEYFRCVKHLESRLRGAVEMYGVEEEG
jgi:hypothetical protein